MFEIQKLAAFLKLIKSSANTNVSSMGGSMVTGGSNTDTGVDSDNNTESMMGDTADRKDDNIEGLILEESFKELRDPKKEPKSKKKRSMWDNLVGRQ